MIFSSFGYLDPSLIQNSKVIYQRLSQRGYTKNIITSEIIRASELIQQKMPHHKVFQKKPPPINNKGDRTLYFQRTYHPRAIPSELIQKTFTNTIRNTKLFNRLIICNKRPKNVKDRLSKSTLTNLPGHNPSNYIQEESLFRDI